MDRREVASVTHAAHAEALTSVTKKRYFVIHTNNKTKFEYPAEFAAARGRRWVHVLGAHLYVEDSNNNTIYERPNFAWLHASFVQDDPYLDHIVCLCNDERGDRKKYEQYSNDRYLDVWITDFAQQPLPLNSRTHLLVELMLEYTN